MLTLKRNPGLIIIFVLSVMPLLLWLPTLDGKFSLRSLGQISALIGAVLLSINFILSSRIKFLEKLFDGLNRVYIYHHLIGEVALILLLFHPMLIALFYLRLSVEAAFDIIFPPLSEYATWFGTAAIVLLSILLFLTLYVKPPYDIWKITHKFMGLVLVFVFLHIYFINSSVSENLPLRFYELTFVAAGLLSYLYRTIFGKILVKRYKYKIDESKILDEITEVTLSPTDKKINYLPGQFIFINFSSLGVTKEEHPFSLTSIPSDPTISISAKSVGNYTETLKLLKPGGFALIEGPFGAFSYLTKPLKKQIWIAGGIGITPFISMAKSLSENSDFNIHLYYVVSTPEEAVYLNLLKEISLKTTIFKLSAVYTKAEGRLNAEKIKTLETDLPERDILLCGPPPMMKSLRQQFNKLGISNAHIFSEEFSID